MTINALLSAVLVALALGVVSADEKLTISGLAFKLSLSTLMIGGALVSATLVVLFVALQRRRQVLEHDVWSRYETLGIDQPDAELANPFRGTSPLESATPTSRVDLGPIGWVRAVNLTTSVLVSVTVLLFPVAAQTTAILAVVHSYDSPAAWLFLAIPGICLLTVLAWAVEISELDWK